MKKILYILILSILISCDNKAEYKKNGILVDANISRKEKLRKKKYTQYAFYVMYFTDPSKANPKPKDTVKKTKNVDEILESMSIKNMEFGEFQGRHLYVDKEDFDKYNVGDKIKIYYLKNDCTQIKLKEDVDE